MSAWANYEQQMAKLQAHRERIRLKAALFDQEMAAIAAHMQAMQREATLYYQEYTAASAQDRELTPDTYSPDLQRAVAETAATYTAYLDARRAYNALLDLPEEAEPEVV